LPNELVLGLELQGELVDICCDLGEVVLFLHPLIFFILDYLRGLLFLVIFVVVLLHISYFY
jgi:hypothetical protein